MTGYGRATQIFDNREITVEIRSVNSRYLDLNIKSPRNYGFLDDKIKKIFSQFVFRGKADIFISIDTSKSDDTSIEVNHNILKNYLAALNEISEISSSSGEISVVALSKFPEVLTVKKEELDRELITQQVIDVLKNAILEFNEMRQKEGLEMKKDILLKQGQILKYVIEIEELSPKTTEAYRERLYKKLSEVLESSQISEDRILAEASIFADKVSVDEETVRLKSHISQLLEMLELSDPIGRKLDFLIQEFNREVNTIGSKASDSDVTKIVIELKALIEKIREQIQNME